MKHLSYSDKAVFLDDETADLLLEYTGLLAAERGGDTVTVRAVAQDGNEVHLTVVLNAATSMAGESTNSDMVPPSNAVAVEYLREKIALIRTPPVARPIDESGLPSLPRLDGEQG
ncbi:hypothetical protein JNB62_17000 [Microbacterium jejuense]|uniref:Uncharacterized protein n=1 Tax=Microbacterium jejuense TaxID=1263637 RepID=A0ABS7HT23_9MICO|nr:hypothetical protein [Microbacterium jejuense]MBW9095381.1 hypothetical protein [Microbacterium jejuense]